jgi:ABC-type uncharacterized transport system permease subunit
MSDLLIVALLMGTLRMSTPLLLTAMGGLLSERSGVVNIALEGFMLVGAFTGAVAGYYFKSAWMGFLASMIFGGLIAALYSLFVIKLKADQIVTGTAINLFAAGVAPFISKILFNSTGSTPSLELAQRFVYEPIVIAILVTGFVYYLLEKTKAGLWISFAGEHPESLLTAGVHPNKIRYFSVIASGVLAAMGGASLSLFLASSYSPMMSGGRGFMALAAVIFGKWKPLPTAAACLFFGFTDSLQIRLQGVAIGGFIIPVQFIQILPYLVTILILSGFFGKSRAPKSLSKIFET